ncbi:hypothetical protein Aros01_07073 [Streptosporangium roseum]
MDPCHHARGPGVLQVSDIRVIRTACGESRARAVGESPARPRAGGDSAGAGALAAGFEGDGPYLRASRKRLTTALALTTSTPSAVTV